MKVLVLAFTALSLTFTSTATTAAIAFMTGTQNPWGLDASDAGSVEAPMVTIYGSGGYTRYQGFTTSAFTQDTTFIYLDGSERAGQELINFLGANPTLISNYINAGGRLYINAALTLQPNAVLPIGLGLSLVPGASLTGDILGDPLSLQLAQGGAGTNWTGQSGEDFSTHVVSGMPVLGTFSPVYGTVGPNFLWTYSLTSGGYLFVGAQTAPAFHSAGGIALRTNELCLANGGPPSVCGDILPPVPEPATWAMLIIGFGAIGGALRHRRRQVLHQAAI
jgi:hypothetical protein